MIGYAAVAAAVLAWLPWLGPLSYPFRLFSTLVHELSHGLAALATGGEFLRFVIQPDGSGLATTAGGWRLFVIPAGYLGTALFGACLILSGRTHRLGRWVLGATGCAIALLSLRYALPGLFAEGLFTRPALGAGLALVSGVALGALLLWLALKGSDPWIVFGLHLLAIQVSLAALSDLWTLIGLSGLGGGTATDARSMAELTFLPAIFWAVVWALTAGLLIAGAIRWAWSRD